MPNSGSLSFFIGCAKHRSSARVVIGLETRFGTGDSDRGRNAAACLPALEMRVIRADAPVVGGERSSRFRSTRSSLSLGEETADDEYDEDEDDRVTSLQPGDLIDRYLLVRELGRGGMGVVFEAFDPELDRHIALKFFYDQPALDDTSRDAAGKARDRLLAEAKAMASVTHPNVVTVFDVGVVGERVYVAMELIDGCPLGTWLRAQQGHRDWRSIVDVLVAAGEGLRAIHAQGLVHRDFKPDNVMVTEAGATFVLDFGLARRGGPEQPDPAGVSSLGAVGDAQPAIALNEVGHARADSSPELLGRRSLVVGTPSYMSLEQHRGLPVDRASDQFSFGVTAYEALYGQRPFVGESLAELAEAIERGRVPGPPTDSGVPDYIYPVLCRALAALPEQRYVELEALLRALTHDPVRAQRRYYGRVALVGCLLVLSAWQSATWLAAAQRCDARVAQRMVERSWNPERRAAIRHRIVASGLGFADAVAGRVDSALTQRWRAWADARRKVCQVESELEMQARTSLRRTCLADRRDETIELIGSLERIQAKDIARVDDMWRALAPVSDCDDPARLADRQPQPADPRQRGEVAALRRIVERSALAPRGGDMKAVLASLERAQHRAQELGFEPLMVEVDAALGRVVSEVGRHDEAQAILERAQMLAEAIGYDRMAAFVLSEMMFTRIYKLEQFADADALIEHARAQVLRSGDEPEIVGKFYHMLGPAYGIRGQFEVAVSTMRASLQYNSTHFGEDHPTTLTSLQNLGVALSYLRRPNEALEHFARAIELRTRTVGRDHPSLRLVLSNASLTLMTMGRYTEALAHARRAVEIHEQGRLPPDDLGSRAHRQLGVVQRVLGHHRAAAAAFVRALELREAIVGSHHPELILESTRLLEVQLLLGDDASAGITDTRLAELTERARARGRMSIDAVASFVPRARLALRRGQLDRATALLDDAESFERAAGVPIDHHSMSRQLMAAELALEQGHLDIATDILASFELDSTSVTPGLRDELQLAAVLVHAKLSVALGQLEPAFTRLQAAQPNARVSAQGLHPRYARLYAELAVLADRLGQRRQRDSYLGMLRRVYDPVEMPSARVEAVARRYRAARRWTDAPGELEFVGPPTAKPSSI